jgi:hypothetical protein
MLSRAIGPPWLLAEPFGQRLVMLVGAGIMVIGFALVWKAIEAEFRDQMAADAGKRLWIVIPDRSGT